MTYYVFYGDVLIMAGSGDPQHQDEEARCERFSTEHEALRRARELLAQDEHMVVVIRDAAGNQLSGVRLQLRLGYSCE
jgi:hypothetical protein